MQETAAPFERGVGTAHAGGGEAVRQDCVVRGEADLQRFGLRAVDAELQRPRRRAQGDAERAGELLGRRPRQPRDRGGRAEHAGGRGRMEAACVVHARQRGEADPYRDVVPRHDRGDEVATVGVLLLGDGERGGDDRRAGMERRAFVRIVEVERVEVAGVEQRGVLWTVIGAVADRRAGAAAVERTHGLVHRRRRLTVAARPQRQAGEVEHGLLRVLDRLRRQRGELQAGHVGGKPPSQRNPNAILHAHARGLRRPGRGGMRTGRMPGAALRRGRRHLVGRGQDADAHGRRDRAAEVPVTRSYEYRHAPRDLGVPTTLR